jgi:phosphatidylglycerol:prolipoprotein diacylglycerol transferase
MRPDQADDFLLWATLGTVIGGRLGFVLFYEPSMFAADPLRIFKIWEGGMAFHGGLLGVGLAIYLFARRNGVPVRSLMDLSAAAVPFGLFFGRLANFINGEVYGRLTDVPWAVVFPAQVLSPGDVVGPRHPTQIYEAILEGLVIFALIRYLTHSRLAFHRPGVATGAFLIAYGVFRIFAEYFKEWDMAQFFTTPYFSEAMIYSLPMIMLGAYYLWSASAAPPQARVVERKA